MTTQHTPGPWRQDTYSNGEAVVYNPDREEVARVLPQVFPEATNRRDNANARLIAAAPELLEACKELIRLADDGAYIDLAAIDATPISRKLRAAIAKAEKGGSL